MIFCRIFFLAMAIFAGQCVQGMDVDAQAGSAAQPADELAQKSLQSIVSDLIYGNKVFGERGFAALQLQLQTGQLRGPSLNQVFGGENRRYTALTALLRQPGAMRDAGRTLLSKLVEAGAEVNVLDNEGNATEMAPLFHVCSVREAEFLVQHGANPTVHLPNGDTLLHHALKAGHDRISCAMVPWCVARGLHLQCNKDGRDPLLQCAFNESVDCSMVAALLACSTPTNFPEILAAFDSQKKDNWATKELCCKMIAKESERYQQEPGHARRSIKEKFWRLLGDAATIETGVSYLIKSRDYIPWSEDDKKRYAEGVFSAFFPAEVLALFPESAQHGASPAYDAVVGAAGSGQNQ